MEKISEEDKKEDISLRRYVSRRKMWKRTDRDGFWRRYRRRYGMAYKEDIGKNICPQRRWKGRITNRRVIDEDTVYSRDDATED